MRVSFAVFCHHANVSHGDLINVMGQFDGLAPTHGFPFTVTGFYVARLIFGWDDTGEHRIVLRFVNDDGDLLGPEMKAALAGGVRSAHVHPGGVNLILQSTLRFDGVGEHMLELWVDGEQIHRLSLYVDEPAAPTA
jgi:hypothetical protein